MLAKALGVNQLLVVVNKLDATDPPWSEERYEAVKAEVAPFLTRTGFRPKKASVFCLSRVVLVCEAAAAVTARLRTRGVSALRTMCRDSTIHATANTGCSACFLQTGGAAAVTQIASLPFPSDTAASAVL